MTSPSKSNNSIKRDIRQVLDVLKCLERKKERFGKDMDELFFYLGEVIQEVESLVKSLRC